MSYKKMQYIMMGVAIVLPLMSQGMLRTLALFKRTHVSSKPIVRRTFFNSAPELRNKIATPKFKLFETEEMISKLPNEKVEGCDANGLIEHIVFKATEYKSAEQKYAKVLAQLREHGWSKGKCCVTVMLHSAVISDLPHVTGELLRHDATWVHDTDFHDCVPMDYAQSSHIKKMLKDYGSRDAQPYTG